MEKMSIKIIMFVTVAVASLGIIILPYTSSLFAGQHTWYNLSSVGSDVPCEKCHADVKEEMGSGIGPHTGETGYGGMKCEYCHRFPPVWRRNQTFENYTYASVRGSDVTPGKESHAASTVPCMYCHSGNKYGVKHSGAANMDCWSMCHWDPDQNPNDRPAHEGRYTNSEDCRPCHADAHTGDVYYIPPAGGFGLTTNASDTGKNASHISFVRGAIGNNTMEDANEACLACHTKMRVEVWFNVTTEAKITVNNSYTQSSSYWDIIEIEPSNYTTYKEVKGG
ncbi:MAG: hypothetical protein ACXQTS_07415 [Candidatus Methanospirareceae archaeon]